MKHFLAGAQLPEPKRAVPHPGGALHHILEGNSSQHFAIRRKSAFLDVNAITRRQLQALLIPQDVPKHNPGVIFKREHLSARGDSSVTAVRRKRRLVSKELVAR